MLKVVFFITILVILSVSGLTLDTDGSSNGNGNLQLAKSAQELESGEAFNSENISVYAMKETDWDAINKWTNFGTLSAEATILQDLDSVVNLMDFLGGVIPALGPISTVLSSILGFFRTKPDEFGKLNNRLDELDRHLFAIENKIDDISNQIVYNHIIAYYKNEAKKINIVQNSYQRYYKLPNEITTKEFKIDCKLNIIREYINYVYEEITKDGLQSLKVVMKNNYDMKNLLFWSKILVGSVSQAMYLHTICMTVEHENSTYLNETIEHDIKHFKMISDTLANFTRNEINDIKNNFFDKTGKEEILKYGEDNARQNYEEFAFNIWKLMKIKYFWRFWSVVCFDEFSIGNDGQIYRISGGKWTYSLIRKFGRSTFISSTNNPSDEINYRLRECLYPLVIVNWLGKSSNPKVTYGSIDNKSTNETFTNGSIDYESSNESSEYSLVDNKQNQFRVECQNYDWYNGVLDVVYYVPIRYSYIKWYIDTPQCPGGHFAFKNYPNIFDVRYAIFATGPEI